MTDKNKSNETGTVSRRNILKAGGALAGATMVPAPALAGENSYPEDPPVFPAPDHQNAHGDLLNEVGGQTDRPMLVLYVEFDDIKFEDTIPPDDFDTDNGYMDAGNIHERFFGDFPSVADYFYESSNRNLELEPAANSDDSNGGESDDGVVSITIEEDYLDFVDNFDDPDWASQQETLLEEAAEHVDFSQFATDGEVTEKELVIVRHDVSDEPIPEGSGGVRSAPDGLEIDGVTIGGDGGYGVANTGTATNLMTVAHEMGHVAYGMPETYTQEVGRRMDLASSTSNLQDDVLFRHNAWHYIHLGWKEPFVVTESGYYEVPREPAGSSFILYDPDRGTDDHFIVENRAPIPTTYDRSVGDTGLVIWRIDESAYEPAKSTGWMKLISPGDVDVPPWAWNPSHDPKDDQRTVDGLTWRGGDEANIAVRAISPADDVMRVYFDVRDPGVLPDPITHFEDQFGTIREVIYDVTPAEESFINVPVRNTGEETDTFEVYFEGPTGEWGTTSDEIPLEPDEEARASPAVIPVADAPTGEHEVTVVAQSTTDDSVSESATLTVNVVLDITSIEYTGDTEVPIGKTAELEAKITNRSEEGEPVADAPLTFQLTNGDQLISTHATADANGVATADWLVNVDPGSYEIQVDMDRFGKHAGSYTSEEFVVPSATALVQDLKDTVIDAQLHHGIEDSLLSKLDEALEALDEDDEDGACESLNAFLKEVDAQDGKKIPEDDAEAFRSAAEHIRSQHYLDC